MILFFRLWPVPKFDFRVEIQLRKSARCSGCLKFKAVDPYTYIGVQEVRNLKKCNRCKYAKYCSEKCQMSDYAFHKLFCNKHFPKLRPDLEQTFLQMEQMVDYVKKSLWMSARADCKHWNNVTFEEVI